jgi:small subunit ribosomal protein S3
MGQKVHPNAFRLGIYRPWQARWYADKDYTDMLLEDMKMRRLILNRLRNAGISKVETERAANQATVVIWTAKPGIVIGKGGASVDQLRDDLEKMTGKKVRVTIQEIKHPELDAMLVAQNVAAQLERRIAFRRAVKQSVLRTMRAGAKGVKIMVSGRLGGAEMSRREWDRDGRVPLHTLKANIDFGQTEARTTFGRIGVSVWVYLGDFDLTTHEEPFEEIPARQLLDEPRRLPSVPTNGQAAEAAATLAAAIAEAAAPAEETPAVLAAEPTPEAASRPKRAPRATAAKVAKPEDAEAKVVAKAAKTPTAEPKPATATARRTTGKAAGAENAEPAAGVEAKPEAVSTTKAGTRSKAGTAVAGTKTGAAARPKTPAKAPAEKPRASRPKKSDPGDTGKEKA